MRIIAGELKGQSVVLPKGSRIRPATGYVRELAMNLFTPTRLTGGVFLDICAGSGLLGFEALSRGAARVVFVEADRRAAERLRSTALRFGVRDRVAVVVRDARRCFPALRRALDSAQVAAAFLDPPYIPCMAEDLLTRCGVAVDVLAAESLLIVRTPDTLPEKVPGLQLVAHRSAGSGRLWLYQPSTPVGGAREGGCQAS
jgi:16S rRNA (guanine966-N2)-methyltransferase